MSRMGRLLLKILIMCPFVVLLSSCYGDCFFDNLKGRDYSWRVENRSGMWIIGIDGGDFANNFGAYGLPDGEDAVIFICDGPKENVSFNQLFVASMGDPVWVEIYLNDEAKTTIRLRSDSDDEFSRIFFDERNWTRHEYMNGSREHTQWVFTILPEHLLLPGAVADEGEAEKGSN